MEKILEALKDAGQYIVPAIRALLNVFAIIFETLANLIRDGLGRM
jgi:hypothetical protein